METKIFQFKGRDRLYTIEAPIKNGGVRTDKFCPQELLTGGVSIISAINGETEDEFLSDCQKQVMAMDIADAGTPLVDRHIVGLMAVVMDHFSRCGRIIFGDLLIYIDCFSLLLEADGFPKEEIREIYPRVAKTIVDLYPDHVFNTADLSIFRGSHFDRILTGLSNMEQIPG